MFLRKFLIFALLVPLLLACSEDEVSPDADSDPNTADTNDTNTNNNQNQNAVNEANIDVLLGLINSARTNGSVCRSSAMPSVSALSISSTLNDAALNHCIDMRDNIQGLSHTGSNGSNAGDRIEDLGYSWSTWGENIAVGQPTEQSVFEAWMGSNSGHCEAIMSNNFTEIGIARAGNYWTLVFARPR